MILPNKIVAPAQSIIVIGSEVLRIIGQGNPKIDELFSELRKVFPVEISFERYLLCLDFLYMIGIIEGENEVNKIV